MGAFISRYRHLFIACAVLVVCALAVIAIGSTAPGDFPLKAVITVKQGMTLNQTADILKRDGIIRSTFLYKSYTVILGARTGVQSGDYLFDQPQSALRVAYRLANDIEGFARIKVTVPEGLASYDITRLLVRDIPGFDGAAFQRLAKPLEGYLFPDTYFFTENTTPEEAVAAMHDNFEKHVGSLTIPLNFVGRPFHDVMTMASIVEEEATSSADRRTIAGILWKRLDKGMLLQVDPPFFYLFGRTSAQLTLTDLATSSPYNTYKHTGLPPAPIDNPGLDSIYDTVHPIDTPYWFFLAGRNGKIYYAADLAGHIANKNKYIN